MTNITCNLESLIKDNENMVYYLANKMGNNNIKEDLYQVGVIGIIKAKKNYNETIDCKFSTYAYKYILGEMKAYLNYNHSLKISRDIIFLAAKIEKAKEVLMQKLKREPTDDELALFLEIDVTRIREAMYLKGMVKSLDEPINDEGKVITIGDLISLKREYDEIELLSLREALESLDNQERKILDIRYDQDKTQMETASTLNISQVQVSRSERQILTKLRDRLM